MLSAFQNSLFTSYNQDPTFFEEVVSYLSRNWNPIMTVIAVVISALALYLQILTVLKNKISVEMNQINNGDLDYAFAFLYYDRFDCAFLRVQVKNLSRSPVTLSNIMLELDGGFTSPAAHFNIGDFHNENGITLYYRDDQSKALKFNLKSENLLDRCRLEPLDTKSGFLVFFNIPEIPKERIRAVVHYAAASKKFEAGVWINPLPSNLKPFHEPKD